MRRQVPRTRFARLCVVTVVLCLLTLALYHVSKLDALIGQWAPTSLTEVSTNAKTSCAVADGKAYCWGLNTSGQLGNNSTTNSSIPVPVNTSGVLSGKTVTDVSVGADFACAVASGAVFCWGSGTNGKLGNGGTSSSLVPVAVTSSGVLSGKTVTAVAAGDAHACVIASDAAYCWGTGTSGQLGQGASNTSTTPVTVVAAATVLSGKTVTNISAGAAHTCVVASAAAYCWGLNTSGQLGNNSTTSSSSPVAVNALGVLLNKTMTAIGVANNMSCAVGSGAAYCWGLNTSGQLGDNSTTNRTNPVAVNTAGALSGKTISSISGGNTRACALDSNGAAYCWGTAPNGSGTTSASSVPVAVTTSGVVSGVTWKFVSANASYCMVSTANRAYCWGVNDVGQVGDNTTTTPRNTPVEVLSSDNLTNSNHRFYQNANSLTPGAPLAAQNTASQLSTAGQAFRLRMGIKNAATSGLPIDIRVGDASIELQYAVKSAATCSAQSTGFADVTTTTPIAFNTNSSVTHGSAISSSANDPSVASGSITYQTYQSAIGPFSNTVKILNGNTGLWDFSMKDNGMSTSSSYCLKLLYGSGANFEATPVSYPEIKLTPGSLDVSIVDGSGATVSSPSYAFANTLLQNSCQTSTATLGTSSQRIRLSNSLSSTGWSVSIAANGGATSLWNRSDNNAKYDYNDSSGSPAGCNSGSDGDGFAGQLSVDPSVSTISPQSGCSNTGVSKGSSSAYVQSTVDAITLMTGSSSAALNCYWEMTGTGLSQKIPASQATGSYSITMTITAVVQ